MHPQVPETLEGFCVLHQMFRVRWSDLRAETPDKKGALAAEAAALLAGFEGRAAEEGQSAAFHLLGHKGDLMVVHFRKTFDDLAAAELEFAQTGLAKYLEQTHSYVSVIELGLYDATVRLQEDLRKSGVAENSDAWNEAFTAMKIEQRGVMKKRLFPAIPARRYLCFYPMDKKRGETKNWYREDIARRAAMMLDHGKIGRTYAGSVNQIITGSIGFDDWEWGVDLFADEPNVFKKLVYEMRFDEASADYGLFGAFYLSLRMPAAQLGTWLAGKLPAYTPPPAPEGAHHHGRPGTR